MEASEVVAITLEVLVARLRQDPLAALDLTRLACEHLAEAYDRLRSRSADPTMYRLARVLMDLAAELGEPTPEGMLGLHYITQQELAHLIGARREVVSGLLNRLRDQGLIRYSRRGPITVAPAPTRACSTAAARLGMAVIRSPSSGSGSFWSSTESRRSDNL